jgi:plastocyanin
LTVNAGGVEPGHRERDYLAFYPAGLSAHPGDTLRVANPTAGTPHTVTFGVLPDHSNQPALINPGVGFAPVSGGPCVSSQPVTAATTTCPGAPASGPPPAGTPAPEVSLPAPYAAQPYYNSGVFVGGQTVVLPLSASLKPGSYSFMCLLHPTMVTALTVLPAGSPTQTAASLKSAADSQLAADRTDAAAVASKTVPPTGPAVQAGAVGREMTINAFFPVTVSVAAGQTVTWKNSGYEPHLVVFGRQITPDDPQVYGPPTVAPGSDYTKGDAVSGLFGSRPPFPADGYVLRFPTPGKYTYICAIHPGMAGTVEVA